MTDLEVMEVAVGQDPYDAAARLALADALHDADDEAAAALQRRAGLLLADKDSGVRDVWSALLEADGEPDEPADVFAVYEHHSVTPTVLTDDELEDIAGYGTPWVVGPRAYLLDLLGDVPVGSVFLDLCPRGFASEVSYHWTDRATAAGLMAPEWSELTLCELAEVIYYGLDSHAQARLDGVNLHQNPPPGNYTLTRVNVEMR